MTFDRRQRKLPVLGLGLSTEFGAGQSPGSLNPVELREVHPGFASFLEVGVEVHKGLDEQTSAWCERGWPTTYHFLDVNLDEPEDLDGPWLEQVRLLMQRLRPAWMCGDAGMWHFGRRDRNHMLLLPPILTDDSAWALAEGIVALREATGLEVFPENPPGTAYVGDLHLLEFFARVAERADTGLLLDLAHLAIYQRISGFSPLDGLDGFPADRVVEIHLAGGTERETHGFRWIEDDHTVHVLEETWLLLDALAPRLENLKAAVFECERNSSDACLDGFNRIARHLECTPLGPSVNAHSVPRGSPEPTS
ncbi:MAG: DUF692 family protein [Myxococcota bacterium]|nr:DUF692 family protein [Myxococcota bacterium]